MARNLKEDAGFLMVFVGRPAVDDADSGFGGVFLAIAGIAIVAMIFVGLLNEVEQQQLEISEPRQTSCLNRTINDLFKPCRSTF